MKGWMKLGLGLAALVACEDEEGPYAEYGGIPMDAYIERATAAVCASIAECPGSSPIADDVDYCVESYGEATRAYTESEQCAYWPEAAEACVVHLEERLGGPCDEGGEPFVEGCSAACLADVLR